MPEVEFLQKISNVVQRDGGDQKILREQPVLSASNPHIMHPNFVCAKVKAAEANEQTDLPANGEIKERIRML